jgi:hypothetical protein
MGYIRHHAIVVTSSDESELAVVHRKAKEIFGDDFACEVTEMTRPKTNGQCSFLVAPDGSKEGWGTSAMGDADREEFTSFLDEHNTKGDGCVDYVLVQFGDDNGEDRIIRSRDIAFAELDQADQKRMA